MDPNEKNETAPVAPPNEPDAATEDAPLPDGEPEAERVADLGRFGPALEDLELAKKESPRFMQRFMGGRATPEEVWRQFTMRGRKCFGCGSPKGAILIRVFMPLKDAYRNQPELMIQLAHFAAANGVESMPTVQFGQPPEDFIRVSEKVACDQCKATAERAAARGPSWCVVEIKRGPGSLNPIIQAGRLRPQA